MTDRSPFTLRRKNDLLDVCETQEKIIENSERLTQWATGQMDRPIINPLDSPPTGTCAKCGFRTATIWWNERGSIVEALRGMVEPRCELCVIDEQIAFAEEVREMGIRIAALEPLNVTEPLSGSGQPVSVLAQELNRMMEHSKEATDSMLSQAGITIGSTEIVAAPHEGER